MALDDFYDWTPTGQTNFIMLAGSSQTITEFDIWMMRDFWRHLADRYPKTTTTTSSRTTTSTTTSVRTTTAVTVTSRATVPITTTIRTTTRSTTTTPRSTTTTTASTGVGAPLWGQCGGTGWTGPKTCAQGTCTFSNEWYSKYFVCSIAEKYTYSHRSMYLDHEFIRGAAHPFSTKILAFGARYRWRLSSLRHFQYYQVLKTPFYAVIQIARPKL